MKTIEYAISAYTKYIYICVYIYMNYLYVYIKKLYSRSTEPRSFSVYPKFRIAK